MLNVNQPNVISFPLNRIDYIMWKNIEDLGEKSNLIDDYLTLEKFNTVFNGKSVFHHYVQRPEIVEIISDKYRKMKNNNMLTNRQKYMPLIILNPDHSGNTALDLAL
jgi:hypothetical protein